MVCRDVQAGYGVGPRQVGTWFLDVYSAILAVLQTPAAVMPSWGSPKHYTVSVSCTRLALKRFKIAAIDESYVIGLS